MCNNLQLIINLKQSASKAVCFKFCHILVSHLLPFLVFFKSVLYFSFYYKSNRAYYFLLNVIYLLLLSQPLTDGRIFVIIMSEKVGKNTMFDYIF